jgi:hypothetical protein
MMLGALLLGLLAAADDGLLLARETADVAPRGTFSVGLFSPAAYVVAEGVELRAHPLLFLVSPNLLVRWAHVRSGAWRLTSEYGLSVPTPALRLTQGYLFPSWDRSDGQIGWFLVPRAGVSFSRGAPQSNVLTLSGDLAAGIPLSRNDATALGAPAPLELLLAPVLSEYRARVGGIYDHAIAPRWRGRLYVDGYAVGRNSPSTLRAGAAVDWGLFARSRLTLGVVWWNSNQHARDPVTGQGVRSNDFLPTLDFIWEP